MHRNNRLHTLSFGLPVILFTLALSACDGGSLPDSPSPVTTTTQPMTQHYTGMGITASPGEDALWANGEHGVVATGSAYEGVIGIGAPGSAGGWFRSGTPSTATAPQVGIWSNGIIQFQDTPAPEPNVPIVNAVTPSNVATAWARLHARSQGESILVLDGFNVATAAYDGPNIRVTFAHPLANDHYVVFAMPTNAMMLVDVMRDRFGFTISAMEYSANDLLDLRYFETRINVLVFGH
jgi:hypothetical protein